MANVTPAGWNTSQVCPRSDLHPPISVPGAQLGPYPPSFGTGLPLPSRLQLRSTLLLLLLSICGFPCGPVGKESTCNAQDLGSIPGLGKSLGEGKGYPFQCSGLENPMDCTVHGVAELDMTVRLSLHSHRSFVLENRCFTTLCQLLLCSKLSQLDTYTCWAVSLSRVCPFVTLWTVARQAPLSMGFSRQGY